MCSLSGSATDAKGSGVGGTCWTGLLQPVSLRPAVVTAPPTVYTQSVDMSALPFFIRKASAALELETTLQPDN